MKKNLLLIVLLFITTLQGIAQNAILTMEDVVLNSKKSLAPAKLDQLQWIKGTDQYSYINKSKGIETLVSSDPNTKNEKELVSIFQLNQTLKNSDQDTLDAFAPITWNSSTSFSFESKNKMYSYDLVSGKSNLLYESSGDSAKNMDFNKQNGLLAYTYGNNLFILKKGISIKITQETNPDIVCGTSVHRDEFGIHKGTFWSPKGNLLAFYRMDQTMVTDYPILELNERPAGARMIKYPMAGDSSHEVTIGVYDVNKGTTVYLKTGEPKEQYLTNIAWSPDEKKIYVAVLNRDQNHLWLNRYDAASGNFEATLFEETDDKYVQPLNPMAFTDDGKMFIWQSRRDGYNHLYLYDASGKLIRQLTKGPWEVTEFMGYDLKFSRAYFTSTQEKPINRDCYLVGLNDGKISRMSLGDGVHKAQVSNSGNYIIDEYSGPSNPRTINIMNVKNKKVKSLLTAPNPLKNFRPSTIDIFTIKSQSNDDLYCRMYKPYPFDSTKQYPVIVYLYGGPNVQMITNNWLGGASDYWFYYMAEKGYIIFTLDNRGSANRGKAFEQTTFRNLGKVEMEDQISGVKYLMNKRYVDRNRMGIYGWSYGGFMSTSMMTRNPGVFKVAVAGGPVIDWKYYEVMYTERYMDTPQQNPEGYANSNLLNYVQKLKGKLLMIHGTSDDVVVWQQSLMYVKKAVESGINMDYFVYPGHLHNVLGKDRIHLLNKISQYFFENLK